MPYNLLMLVPVEIASFAIDPMRNVPLIILKELHGARTVPIPVGNTEASTIAMGSLDTASQRPLAIDLVKNMMESLGGTLQKVVISDFKDLTFYAHLYVCTDNSVRVIDCRPSDALSLSLRCDTQMFIDETVFEKTQPDYISSPRDRLRKMIAERDTLNFGSHYLE
ncbi:MAG: bifunctional nuclease family protein [Chitinivibrionales bacterium]